MNYNEAMELGEAEVPDIPWLVVAAAVFCFLAIDPFLRAAHWARDQWKGGAA
jgi:hypothetical protein